MMKCVADRSHRSTNSNLAQKSLQKIKENQLDGKDKTDTFTDIPVANIPC